ncbi:MAG: GNAT family N-acetyltransferase [Pedococcus sp.]
MSSSAIDFGAVPWPVRTRRTALRPVSPDDREAVHAYRGLAEGATYLSRGPLDPDEVAERIASDIARARPGHPEPLLGLVVEVEGAVVGDAMVRLEPDDNGMWAAVLGYTIHPQWAGRGLATEVAEALVWLCFTHLGVALVQADVFVPHRASQRVLEKAGLRRVAQKAAGSAGDGHPRMDDYVYAVTAAEWASSSSADGGRAGE